MGDQVDRYLLLGSILMEAVPPIVISESGDVNVFESLSDAERYVEPIDVESEEYRYFDATGLRLRGEVHVERERRGRLRQFLSPPRKQVHLVVPESADRRPGELGELLRSFLARVGSDSTGIREQELDEMTVEELLVAVTAFLGS